MSETDETNDTLSKKTAEDSRNEDVNPSPDGGWGWVVCFAVYWVNFTVAGTGTSSGIVLLGLVDLYNESIPKTAMVGSLYIGSVMCAGPLVLVLMTFQASHRQVIILAGLVAFLSTIASIFAPKIEILYLTHGILTGLSVGMAYFAGHTILASYFKKKRSLAVGIAFCGGGCGIFCLNYLIEKSISFYGMRGTFLLLSGLYLNLIVYGSLCRPLNYVENTKNSVKEMKKNVVNVQQSETNTGFKPEDAKTKLENKSSENKPGTWINNITEGNKYSQYKPVALMDNLTEGITYSQDKHDTSMDNVTEGIKYSRDKPDTSIDNVTEGIKYSLDKPSTSFDNATEGIKYSRDKPETSMDNVTEGIKYYRDKPDTSKDNATEGITYSQDKPGTSIDNVTKRIKYSQDKRLSTVTERVSLQFKTLFSNLFDPVVFKSHGLQLLLFLYFVWSAGEIVPIFLPANVVSVGLSRADGALIMSIYGAFFAVSQLVVGLIADLLHVPISYILCFSMMALTIASIGIPFCRSFIAFAICTAIYAIFHGFTTALRVLLATSILGVKNLGKCYSPVCLLIGVGYIIFPLVSGELYEATQFFGAVFYFNGAILFLGLIASTGLVYMQVKGRYYE